MDQPSGAVEPDWQPVRITRDSVYIDGQKLPGYIAVDGVTFTPGGNTDINRLTVTFLVGQVLADDAMVTATPVDGETVYSSKASS